MHKKSEYVRKNLISLVLYRSSGESFAAKSSIANYVHHKNVLAKKIAVSYLFRSSWTLQVEKTNLRRLLEARDLYAYTRGLLVKLKGS
jgi:hypothetical protein